MKNRYNVTFAKAPNYNAVYEITLEKSKAFSYGNGTFVEVKRDGERDDLIDTRYIKTITEDFDGWCESYLREKFNPDLDPHFVKI